jgi:hypothetical protein
LDSIGIVRPVEGGIGNSTPLQPAGIAARNVVHLAWIDPARMFSPATFLYAECLANSPCQGKAGPGQGAVIVIRILLIDRDQHDRQHQDLFHPGRLAPDS